MKKFLLSIFCLLMVVSLLGCGVTQQASESQNDQEPNMDQPFFAEIDDTVFFYRGHQLANKPDESTAKIEYGEMTVSQSADDSRKATAWALMENGNLAVQIGDHWYEFVAEYYGENALAEKVRKEVALSDAENMGISYAGSCGENEKKIAWFVLKNNNHVIYYVPVEVRSDETGDKYSCVCIYHPVPNEGNSVAMFDWNGGCAILVDNPEIVKVQITLDNGEMIEELIQDGTIAHAYFVPSVPAAYAFLDTEGNAI